MDSVLPDSSVRRNMGRETCILFAVESRKSSAATRQGLPVFASLAHRLCAAVVRGSAVLVGLRVAMCHTGGDELPRCQQRVISDDEKRCPFFEALPRPSCAWLNGLLGVERCVWLPKGLPCRSSGVTHLPLRYHLMRCDLPMFTLVFHSSQVQGSSTSSCHLPQLASNFSPETILLFRSPENSSPTPESPVFAIT